MDFKIPKFDELKDRLGIGEASGQAGSRPSRGRDSHDDAVDYGDYGEYGFDDSADYAVGNESSSSSFTASLPKLVTSDDVRANIQYTPSEAPEAADASQATRPNRDFGALREDSHRSPGVNSLFEPSSAAQPAASALQAAASSTGAYAQTTGSIPASASPSGEGRVVQRPARIVTIVKPESYDDAERIAKVHVCPAAFHREARRRVHDDSARVCAHELDSEQKRHSGRYRNGVGEGLRSVSEPFP